MAKASSSIDLKAAKDAHDDAAKTATSYITDIDSQDGITIKAVNGKTDGADNTKKNYIKLNANDGLEIYKDGVSVAKYSNTARVGPDGKGRVEIAPSGIDMYGYNADAVTPTKLLAHIGYELGNAETDTAVAPYYTFGSRDDNSTPGNYSFASGIRADASGYCSHAFGSDSIANGNYQTVMGLYNIPSTDHIFIIGNGASNLRRNALAVSNHGEIYQGLTTLELGTYIASGCLTSTGQVVRFSIPTGRTFPPGTTITNIAFKVLGRVSNSNGQGTYFIKSTSGGYNPASFDSSSTSTFYDAANNERGFLSSMWTTMSIQGGTNIYIVFDGKSAYYFSGSTTINGYTNNQPVILQLSDIVITLSNPFWTA